MNMNKKFKEAIKEALLGFDESMNAEIFNIFANDIDNLEQTLRKDDVYVFNIMDNRQAALAVRKFGFEAVANATKDDWVIYAERDANDQWQFSSKAPSATVEQYLEHIIYDIASRPKEYPSYVWEVVAGPLTNLIAGL